MMSNCNQGCDKMAHHEHGAKEFVDINKTVNKEQPKQEDGIHKQRIDVEAIFNKDTSGTQCLKKSECQ
uniref:DUF4033 domain-containing protein n=2 Tax=Caenorhabditis tropicalis TaxID=1561998 RepID=A0A1I7UGD8_9PELO